LFYVTLRPLLADRLHRDTNMTTTTENQTAKTNQAPAFYIFENTASGQPDGKPTGAAFPRKKGRT